MRRYTEAPLRQATRHCSEEAKCQWRIGFFSRLLVILARMVGMDERRAREGFTKQLRHVPVPLRKMLTYDRGKERAEHEQLAQRLALQIFFADPHAPWQRGTNENTHGLLRQYLPKGRTCLAIPSAS